MDTVITKVQKHVDTLKAKNAKLSDENAKLKAQLTAAKQLHSRIRRIAKKPGDETTVATVADTPEAAPQ